MSNIFEKVALKGIKKNKFDLSHSKKLSCKMGELIPIFTQEIVPGDNFRVHSEIMMRLAPMTAPVMHRVDVYTHYFYVPNRLIWDEWADFITGGIQGDLEPAVPRVVINADTQGAFVKGSLSDFLGIPPTDGLVIGSSTGISSLPFRAYQLIYNEYFIDETLGTPATEYKDGGDVATAPEVSEQVQKRKRMWGKDYFTSALPFAQRGQSSQLPLGSVSPIYKANPQVYSDTTGSPAAGTENLQSIDGTLTGTGAGTNLNIKNLEDNWPVDPITINDFRKANRLQKWLERQARGGGRLVETILSQFGVKSDDLRLSRPQYLGGGKNPIVISEVLNTAGDQEGTTLDPLGQMGGHGLSIGKSNSFSQSFKEHGWVIGIMSVLPKTAYQDGIHRHFQRRDKFEYYWPEFAHLGEQEVINRELYHDYNNPTQANQTFGYQQRYAEYKYACSTVHGEFRDTLKYWHMGRQFNSLPALNEEFVTSDPTKRIFAVEDPTVEDLYVQIFNKVSAIRPMPYFAVPDL